MPQLQLDIPTEARKGKYKCRIEYTDTIHSITFSPYQQKQRKSVALAFDDNICYKYKSVDRRNLTPVDNGIVTERPICVNELHYKNVYFINAMMDLEEAQKLPITVIRLNVPTGSINPA
jgi:hypothetical protein